MKLLGFIIIAVSLCAGALATTTAYMPTLAAVEPTVDSPDKQLTLNGPAGAEFATNDADEVETDVEGNPVFATNAAGGLIPLAGGGTVIDRALYDRLIANGVTRVRVKEFSFKRWQYAWLFGVAVGGLIVGGALVKTAQRKEIARRAATGADSPESPEAAFAAVRTTVNALAALPSGQGTNQRIIDEVGELQQTHLRTLAESRAMLIGRLGMGGYAQYMDRFSAMERKLNRAWSAAADGVPHEAYNSLHDAHALIPEVDARLKGA